MFGNCDKRHDKFATYNFGGWLFGVGFYKRVFPTWTYLSYDINNTLTHKKAGLALDRNHQVTLPAHR